MHAVAGGQHLFEERGSVATKYDAGLAFVRDAGCCSACCMLGLVVSITLGEQEGIVRLCWCWQLPWCGSAGLAAGLSGQLWEGSEMLAAGSARHAGQCLGLLLAKVEAGSAREKHQPAIVSADANR